MPEHIRAKIRASKAGKGNGRSGTTHSQETKIKISVSQKGKPRSHTNGMKGKVLSVQQREEMSRRMKHQYASGQRIHHMLGKTFSQESRKKMSESHKGQHVSDETRKKLSEIRKGENSHFWKGGISQANRTERMNFMRTLEYKSWRKAVFERDEYTCQMCFVVGGILNADHIKPYSLFPELRLDIDNGRTLCAPCHRTTDSYAGRCKKLTLNCFVEETILDKSQ